MSAGGTSTESGLLAAVAHDFDADLPRLILADYYDDHGKPPLARFIRAQLAVANSPPGHPHYVGALEEQAVALAGVRGAAMLPAPELPEGFGFAGHVDELEADGVGAYRRGFADILTIDGNRTHGHSAALARAITSLHETTLARGLKLQFVDSPTLQSILSSRVGSELRSLRLLSRPNHHSAFSEVARNLSRGPLRELALYGPRDSGWSHELAQGEFPALKRLAIGSGRGLDEIEWPALTQSAWIARLELLDLGTGAEMQLIMGALGPRLHTLEFHHLLGRGNFVAPLSAPSGLKQLVLRNDGLPEAAARQLASWPLPPLASFVLNRCTLTQPALAALAHAPWLHSVEELALIDCAFDPEQLPVLLARLAAGSLRKLHLKGADLTAAALEWLATAPATQSLTTLDLRGSPPVRSRGHAGPPAPGYLAQHFAKHWRGERLHTLLLDQRPVGSAAAKLIAANPKLASLRRLSLRGCRLGDSSGAALLSSPHLARVEEWGLASNQLGASTAARLRDGTCAPCAVLIDLGGNRLKPDERAALRLGRVGVWA